MPSPLGWECRDDRGIVGALARWWGTRRVRRIRRALNDRR